MREICHDGQVLQITTIRPAADIYDLPWSTPLEDWPEDLLAVLPRGISRHTVRFVRTSQGVIAVKEIKDDIAYREYHLLRALIDEGFVVHYPEYRTYGPSSLLGELSSAPKKASGATSARSVKRSDNTAWKMSPARMCSFSTFTPATKRS